MSVSHWLQEAMCHPIANPHSQCVVICEKCAKAWRVYRDGRIHVSCLYKYKPLFIYLKTKCMCTSRVLLIRRVIIMLQHAISSYFSQLWHGLSKRHGSFTVSITCSYLLAPVASGMSQNTWDNNNQIFDHNIPTSQVILHTLWNDRRQLESSE